MTSPFVNFSTGQYILLMLLSSSFRLLTTMLLSFSSFDDDNFLSAFCCFAGPSASASAIFFLLVDDFASFLLEEGVTTGAGSGFTSDGFLSSLKCKNTGWRSMPSLVISVYFTSATNVGFNQVTAEFTGIFCEKGEDCCLYFCISVHTSFKVLSGKPVPV